MKGGKRILQNHINIFLIIHGIDSGKIPLLILRAFLKAALPFAVALISAEIVNRLYRGEDGSSITRYALLAVLFIFILNLLLGWVKRVDEVATEQCVRHYNLRKNRKLMEMDFPELENPKLSETLSKIHMDELMGFHLPLMLRSLDDILKGFFSVVMTILWLTPVILNLTGSGAAWITLFTVGSLAFSALASLLFKRSNDKMLKAIQNVYTPEMTLSEYLMYRRGYDYKYGKDVRIYEYSDKVKNCFHDAFTLGMKMFARSCATKPAIALGISGISRAVSMGGSYLLGALLVMNGSMELGTVVLFSALLFQCSDAFTSILSSVGLIATTSESIQKVVEFTAIPDRQYKGTIPVEKRNDNEYEVEFRNVTFKYPESVDYALRDFSIRFKIGQRLAIVGMNGSGKTTMIKLLCRLYEPMEGVILLNGVDIQKYDRHEYMNIFSVVFQDYKLFSFELGQVLAASHVYNAKRGEDCLERAGFKDRFQALPYGMKTVLYKDYENGIDLSGGEAQKIALARALYKDAPFIILDEPTAALDPIAEYEIYARMNEIVGGKTAVFISHRLSSCRFCDDIAVFHKGRMVQRGGHNELLSDLNGKYYELWNAQAQYYVN